MGVSPSRSRVAELAFSVYGRAIHPEWFSVRSHRRVAKAGWEADIRLIEGGHAITWASGPARVTEVLAGPETTVPDPGILFHSPVRRERSTRLRPGPRVEYFTCFEVEKLDPLVFARLTEELALDPSRGDLVRRFASAGRLAPEAISRVHVDTRGRGLSVQAYHTFPSELAIVRTQSLFEIFA